MNNFPTLLGNEPRVTGVRLYSRYPFLATLGPLLNAAWRARYVIMLSDEKIYDFVLLLRMESAYKRCCPLQIRFLLYTLPFGGYKGSATSPASIQLFHETYYLPDQYNFQWFDFSERRYGEHPDFCKSTLTLAGQAQRAKELAEV